MALFLLLCIIQLFCATIAADRVTNASQNLTITAISARNGSSTLECWRLAAPFVVSSEAGITGGAFAQLGQAGNVSYGIIPPRYEGGLHNGPAIQYVSFTSGEAVISVPGEGPKAYIRGGRDGLIFVADIAAVSRVGHLTQYPSNKTTTLFQIPTAGGIIPRHTVLFKGPCPNQSRRGKKDRA